MKDRAQVPLVAAALAGCGLLAVCLGVYAARQTTAVTRDLMALHARGMTRADDVSALGGLASALSAPGHEVFESHDVRRERVRMEAARRAFDARLAAIEEDLRATAAPPRSAALVEMVSSIRSAEAELCADATLVFWLLERGRPVDAGSRLASMDRRAAVVDRAIDTLGQETAHAEALKLDERVAGAAHLVRLEYAAAAGILLLVAGTGYYGRQIGRGIAPDEAARDAGVSDERASTAPRRATQSGAFDTERTTSRFLATMGDQLRSPLNAIIGSSELLHEEAAAARNQRMTADVRRIRSASRQLLSVIDDLLDISRIEMGAIELHPEVFDVSALVAEAESATQPLAEKTRTRLDFRCQADVGTMRADLTRVRQSLLNLLTDGCAAGDGGVVSLAVTRRPDRDGDRIEFVVCADAASAGRTEGRQPDVGLGLAVSRRLCRLMGGDLVASGGPGTGAAFNMRIPAGTGPGPL